MARKPSATSLGGLVVMMMMMVVVVMVMVASAGLVRMRLADSVRGSGDRRAGDAEAKNEGGKNFFHDLISFVGTPVWAQMYR